MLVIQEERDREPIARGLGITDAWDFSQHKIDGNKIDFASLRALFDTFDVWSGSFRKSWSG